MFVRILYTNNRKRRQNKWHAIFPIPTAPADTTMAVAVTTVQTKEIPTAVDATTALTIPTAVDAIMVLTTAIPMAADATMVLTTAIPTAVAVTAAATNAVAAETVKQ